jgi:hypothetical protein
VSTYLNYGPKRYREDIPLLEIQAELDRFTLMDEFGWTPREIDALGYVEIQRTLAVLAAVKKYRKKQAKAKKK